MRQTPKAIIAGFALGLMLPLAALAEPMKHDGHGQKFAMHMERMAEELELTDQQKQQIESMKAAHKKDREALRQRSKAFHEKVHESDPDKLSKADIAKLSREAGALHEARTKAMLEGRAEFYKVLTPEQKAKLREMQAQRRERWQDKRDSRREQHRHDAGMGAQE